ncbi:unnamed protein product [Mucor hiemalis]
MTKQLKKKHASDNVTDFTEEEKWGQVREYLTEHHSYELTQNDIDRVLREKENRKARLQRKTMKKSSTITTASPSTSTYPSPSTSTSQRTPKPSISSSKPSASSSTPSSSTARKGKRRSVESSYESPTTRSKKTTNSNAHITPNT